jgi:hypothetical protein
MKKPKHVARNAEVNREVANDVQENYALVRK